MIIGFCGKKQSGKNTCGNYILGTCLWMSGLVKNTYVINNSGQLVVSDILGDEKKKGIFDLRIQDPNFQKFLYKEVYPIVKLYAFADILKDVCANLFGIDPQLLWGDDNKKNTLTNLKWENTPGYAHKDIIKYIDPKTYGLHYNSGYMTVREVLEYVGTDIFRKMYENVWIDSLLRKIKQDNSYISVITDVRFPNEVEAIQNIGGKTVRLTRGLESGHTSNIACDSYNDYDFVIDNKNMSIIEQNEKVDDILKTLGIHTYFGVN